MPIQPPGGEVIVRLAEERDLGWIDALHKKQSKSLGFATLTQFRGNMANGEILVAMKAGRPVGYVLGKDRYFKREDTGVVFQMNIDPAHQRGLVAATLLEALFERAAHGCRLFCCWCAQDLPANRFWEAMGFVPLAFRMGSRKKGPRKGGKVQPRTHIFWQKAVRAEDAEAARNGTFRGWWFPSQTGGGAIREDRIVLPIPPGVHWSDAMPQLLPEAEYDPLLPEGEADGHATAPRRKARKSGKGKSAAPPLPADSVAFSGLRFAPAPAPAPGSSPAPGSEDASEREASGGRRARSSGGQPRLRNAPALIAAARELRDRWLEEVAASPGLVLALGKYDVDRHVRTGLSGMSASSRAVLGADGHGSGRIGNERGEGLRSAGSSQIAGGSERPEIALDAAA